MCASASASGPSASRSIRVCRSDSCCSTGRGPTRSRRCSSSNAAAARSTCPAALPRSATARTDARRLEAEVAENGFAKADDRELTAFLESAGRLYRVGDGFAVSPDLYERGTETIQTLAPITLAGFRDALGISRRVAQLLLERYDADGLTRRVGDERVLRRAARR